MLYGTELIIFLFISINMAGNAILNLHLSSSYNLVSSSGPEKELPAGEEESHQRVTQRPQRSVDYRDGRSPEGNI